MNNSGLSKRGNHSRKRLYKGIKGKRPDLKANRCKSAHERQQAYDKLTTKQKIDLLDRSGLRAVKQRARLENLLKEEMIASAQKKSSKQEKSEKKR